MDENFAQHERAQSMPIAGGRTADEVGKWDLKGMVRPVPSIAYRHTAHTSCTWTSAVQHPHEVHLASPFPEYASELHSRSAHKARVHAATYCFVLPQEASHAYTCLNRSCARSLMVIPVLIWRQVAAL